MCEFDSAVVRRYWNMLSELTDDARGALDDFGKGLLTFRTVAAMGVIIAFANEFNVPPSAAFVALEGFGE